MTTTENLTTASAPAPGATNPPLSNEVWDVIIFGGGVSGLSAALILARARRRVLVIDAQEPRNRFAAHMHGVLGRDGYSPRDLVADGYREVRAADGVVETGRVVEARTGAEAFEVVTDSGARASGRRLIVATGGRDQLPDIPGLAEQWGRGVVTCPYCDGYEASGRSIGVLLRSVAGAHVAHMLRSYSENITVFTDLAGPFPGADRQLLQERGMRVETRAVTHVVSRDGQLTGLTLEDGTIASVGVVFVEPALVALDEPLQQLGAELADTPFGPWTAVDAVGRTSVAGVWAVGNASNPSALVPVAMGSGVTAALAINSEFVAEEVAAASAALTEAGQG